MKITVINATEKKGVTYKLKEAFLETFRDNAEITEFYLPKDGPGFASDAHCASVIIRICARMRNV